MWKLIPVALLALAAVRVLYLLVLFESGAAGIYRYHVESAACIFLVIGAAIKWFRER